MYRAALEHQGVPPVDARKNAANLRLLQIPTSMARAKAISEIAQSTDHNLLIRAAKGFDATIVAAIRDSLSAITTTPERRMEPVRVNTSNPTVLFERGK